MPYGSIQSSCVKSGGWYSTGAPNDCHAPFDQKFCILLNVAVGGGFPGYPSAASVLAATPFPQTMLVRHAGPPLFPANLFWPTCASSMHPVYATDLGRCDLAHLRAAQAAGEQFGSGWDHATPGDFFWDSGLRVHALCCPQVDYVRVLSSTTAAAAAVTAVEPEAAPAEVPASGAAMLLAAESPASVPMAAPAPADSSSSVQLQD